MPKDKISESIGVCMCTHEPRGDKGLEGYAQLDFYLYQRCRDPDNQVYYRLYPTLGTSYFETCSERTFFKYFKEENGL